MSEQFPQAPKNTPERKALQPEFEERAAQYRPIVHELYKDSEVHQTVLLPFLLRLDEKYGAEAQNRFLYHVLRSSSPNYRGKIRPEFDFEGEDSIARFLDEQKNAEQD